MTLTFWEFHQKGVESGPHLPCRYLTGCGRGGGEKPVKSKGCKTRKEAVEDKEITDLSTMVW